MERIKKEWRGHSKKILAACLIGAVIAGVGGMILYDHINKLSTGSGETSIPQYNPDTPLVVITPTPEPTPIVTPVPADHPPAVIISYEIPDSVYLGSNFHPIVNVAHDQGLLEVYIEIQAQDGVKKIPLEKADGPWKGTCKLSEEGNYPYSVIIIDDKNQKSFANGSIVCEAKVYSEFYGFPDRFFEGSSVSREQVGKVVDAQYLSLKKMHNGISPYKFCKVEYNPPAFGHTTPYGFKLGDFAFPGLNSGHHRWEVMAHEQGHNFFGGTSSFYYGMAEPYPFLQESLAVLSAFYTYHDILTNQQDYGIDDNTIDSLVFDFTNGRAFQEDMYNEYIEKDRNFDIDEVLTSQALDFKMITYGEKYGWDKYERLAKAFENELGDEFNFHKDGATATEQSTYIIAALSVAFNQDFRQEFRDLNFPIDDEQFEEFLPKIEQYVGPG